MCYCVVSSSIRALWTTTSLLLYYSIAILSTEATRKKPGAQVYPCIDTVTNLAEIIRIDNKSSQHIADQFQNCWLAQYPFPPNRCVHDNNDGKFLGQEFQTLLSSIHPFLPCILGSK